MRNDYGVSVRYEQLTGRERYFGMASTTFPFLQSLNEENEVLQTVRPVVEVLREHLAETRYPWMRRVMRGPCEYCGLEDDHKLSCPHRLVARLIEALEKHKHESHPDRGVAPPSFGEG